MPDVISDPEIITTDDSLLESILRSHNATLSGPGAAMEGSISKMQKLRKWGFEQAIMEIECPQKKVQDMISDNRKMLEEKVKAWDDIYKNFKERYEAKIKEAEVKITEKQSENIDLKTGLEALLEQRNQVLNEIEEIRTRLYNLREKLAIAKQDMTDKWMFEVERQIEGTARIQKLIYEEEKNINQQNYNNEKPALAIRIDQMKKARQYLHDKFEEIHDKIKLIGAEGINPFATYFLIGLGVSLAGAAGFFFSIFTYNSNFGNQDLFYYLLNGLMASSSDARFTFWEKIVFLVGTLVSVTLISWCCQLLLRKYKKNSKDDPEEKFRHGLNVKFRHQGIGYYSGIRTNNWYALWLNILPLLVFIALIILVLSFNKVATEQINALNASNEGLVVGTILALGLAAVMYLYILKVIEPRMLRVPEFRTGAKQWIKRNWELSGCVLFFLGSGVSVVFHYINQPLLGSPGNMSGQSISALAILFFLSVCLLAAFAMAYGVRFRGMISIGQRLERNIYYLDDLIASNSVPLIPEVNITYANKMQDLSNDLFAIARNKALLLRGVSGDTILTGIFERNSDHNKGFLKNLQTYFRQLKDLFRGNVKRVRNSFEDLSYLEDWERKYFPDFDEKIKIIVADHTDKQAELTEINNQIESVQADTNTKKILRENELEKLHTDIDKWRIIIFKSLSHKIERIDDFRMISLEKETNILDGFHLGIWYRENKMGPLDNYFTSCIKMNGNGVKST